MCFGNQTTKTQTTTNTPDPQVQQATSQNLDWLSQIQQAGFPGYTGQRVADFGPLQSQSFNMAGNTATDPQYLQRAQDLVNQYSSNPAGNVQTSSIASGIPQYMSAFTDQALDPQLRLQKQQFDQQNRDLDASATMAGAFGDDRTGIARQQQTERQDAERSGLIGSAYQQAYDRAIGASAQDVSNNMNAQTTNAGLMEQYLARALGGANANEQLQNQQLGVASGINALGQQQTGQSQAQLDAPYQQWMMQNFQWLPQIAQLMNQSISTGTKGLPSTSTQVTQQPDNSGFGFLGSLAGNFLSPIVGGAGEYAASAMLPLMFSDEDLKEDIEPVGHLFDGTPVYSYRYKGDPVTRIGLIAQDVEKTNPDAVHEVAGYKAVDYHKATEPARKLMFADAFGL